MKSTQVGHPALERDNAYAAARFLRFEGVGEIFFTEGPRFREIVRDLQVHPEFCRVMKVRGKQQSCAGGNAPLSFHNLIDAVLGYPQCTRQLRLSEARGH